MEHGALLIDETSGCVYSMFLLQDINAHMNLSAHGPVPCMSDGWLDVKGAQDMLRTLRVCVEGCEAGMWACLEWTPMGSI